MQILFIIIFVISSQLIHSVAVDQQTGYNPYPFGTTLFCLLQHPILLVASIFYLGWLWGVVFFLCHLFGIIHITVSWIFDIPTLLAKDVNELVRFMKLKISLLAPMLIIVLVFTIISLFIGEFKSLLITLQNNPPLIIIAVIVIGLLSISRLIVVKNTNDE